MSEIITVPAGDQFEPTAVIAPWFQNVGISGYFTIPNEIPPSFFEQKVPPQSFTIAIDSAVPRTQLKRHKLRLPTIAETLWAIGFMNLELSGMISRHPIRFMHEPFHAYAQYRSYPGVLRQITARRSGNGFAIETVPVNAPIHDMQRAYVVVQAWRQGRPI